MCEICRLENSAHQVQPSRRSLLRFLGAASAGLALPGIGSAKEVKTPPKAQNVGAPDASLELLTKGNKRYVEGESRRHDFKREREALVGGQNPYAGILSCADSRIAPEYAFDSGRRDLFVCRVPWPRRLRRYRRDHQIAQGQHHAAGPSALPRHKPRSGREGGVGEFRRS